MKTLRSTLFGLICATFLVSTSAAEPSPGFVDFGQFVPSATSREFVEVNLSGGLIQMAAKFTQKQEPEVSQLLASIESVRVNVVGLGDDNRAKTVERMQAIRADLTGGGWQRIVNAQQNKQDVSVYLKSGPADVVQGLVITVLDGRKEAVFVNIVGNVRLDQVAQLGERLDLEPLKQFKRPSGSAPSATDSKPTAPASEK